jgi:hypothetical protein
MGNLIHNFCIIKRDNISNYCGDDDTLLIYLETKLRMQR